MNSQTNFTRVATWFAACGKQQGNDQHLSVQIGVHIEEFVEFLRTLTLDSKHSTADLMDTAAELDSIATALKSGNLHASISDRLGALDALCDTDVTGNAVAWLAGFDKDGADQEVLRSNDAKLVDGKAVLSPAGKILKPEGWTPPNLVPFVG